MTYCADLPVTFVQTYPVFAVRLNGVPDQF